VQLDISGKEDDILILMEAINPVQSLYSSHTTI